MIFLPFEEQSGYFPASIFKALGPVTSLLLQQGYGTFHQGILFKHQIHGTEPKCTQTNEWRGKTVDLRSLKSNDKEEACTQAWK